MTERMLDDTLTATSFAPDAADGRLPGRAQVVIVGGGIAGSSIAYHLAGLGITDVLLLERARIASGTSWHAAGLVARVRGSHPMTELANYGVDLYRGLAEETGVDVHFRPTGSLTLAENDGRMTELRYAAAIARHHGIEARLLEPAEVPEVWPLISMDGLVGALLQPGDGTVNPGYAALALAKGAHDRGVTIREGVRVSALLTEDGSVTGVRTDRGDVEAETVVLACGLWTRDLAATVGVPVPLYAAEHVHVSTEPIEGAHDLLPLVRGLDGYFYARHHAGGLMIGAFEPNGRPRSTASIPEDWAFGEFGPDWEHFAPTRANATRRIPALEHAEFTRFLRAPESFTPDVNFCLGETAEVRNLFVAAGFNSQGIIYSPGAGRALAEWIREGAPTFDASEVDVRRFASSQANERYLHERTREALGRLYAMHWPNLQATTARGIRRSPLYDRLAARGRVLRRARAVGAPDVVRAARRGARLRVLVRTTELVPVRGRGASRGARGGGALRPELVRQDRGDGSGRAPAPPARLHERRGRGGRPVGLHAVPQPARRDRERRDGHATGRGPIPRPHADRPRSTAPSSGSAPTAEGCRRRWPTSPAASRRSP